ncbi:hypothetical protein PQQ76_25140, partial [Paraburkholderia sediminicola]
MSETQERNKHEKMLVGAGVPEGWTEASPGGMATNPDPLNGGIIDRTIVGAEWFVIFNRPNLETLEGFTSRESAFEAFNRAIPASAMLRSDISRVAASEVHVGDKICFDQSRFDVVVERISEAPDGAIGFHGNDETWSTWRKQQDIVWVDSTIHNALVQAAEDRAAHELDSWADNWSRESVNDIPKVILSAFPEYLQSPAFGSTVPAQYRGLVWGETIDTD